MKNLFNMLGTLAIMGGALVGLGAFNSPSQAEKYALAYVGISAGLSGLFFLGFGAVLSFLEQIAENTAGLKETDKSAAGNNKKPPEYQGKYDGIHWWRFANGQVTARFEDGDKDFDDIAEFENYARTYRRSRQ
jgi:hypothetical protein